jgi:hypothetical protein
VAQKKADPALWGTFLETEPEKYSLEEDMSFWMRVFGKRNLAAPRVRRKTTSAER